MKSDELIRVSRAIGEPSRYQILTKIGSYGEVMPLQALQVSLSISGATLSHHIKHLEQVGLIEMSRTGLYKSLFLRREVVRDYILALVAHVQGSAVKRKHRPARGKKRAPHSAQADLAAAVL